MEYSRSCFSKKRYSTIELANTMAAKCYGERGEPIRVYPCDQCAGYHLTSMNVQVKPGWRPPEPSQRILNEARKRERIRGRRFR